MKTYMQTAKALGTDVELRLVTKTQEQADVVFTRLWDMVFDFEKRFSRFDPNSELTKLNMSSGERVEVSDQFILLLNKAKYFFNLTNGGFNPFILADLQRAGYEKSMVDDISDSDNSGLDYKDRKIFSFNEIEIEGSFVKIPKNSSMDFGGIGKGYLADLLSQEINGEIDNYCLSLGGDMIVGGKDSENPWEIEISSFENENSVIGSIKFEEGNIGEENSKIKKGIATSAIIREKKSKKQFHLIDPKTGKVVEVSNNKMCTVVAGDAVTADVLASFFLLEEDRVKDFVDRGIVETVVLQDNNGIRTFGEGFKTKI